MPPATSWLVMLVFPLPAATDRSANLVLPVDFAYASIRVAGEEGGDEMRTPAEQEDLRR